MLFAADAYSALLSLSQGDPFFSVGLGGWFFQALRRESQQLKRWWSRATKSLPYLEPDSSIFLMKIGPQVWISCRISDGMFSNEYGVEILLPSGEGVSLYVDKSLVRGSGDKAELLVTVVDNGHPGEERTVVLPNESLQGSRWVRVPERNLIAA